MNDPRRCAASRRRRAGAGLLVATVGLGAGMLATSGGAAAATGLHAQSVGRFVDGSLGGRALEDVVDVAEARASQPGTTSAQNPLDATVAGKLSVPLTGAVQLPQLAGITLGAVNQVAVARADGYSYGASGAVANSGGASVGGNNAAYPADATVQLDAGTLAGNSPVPVPGGTSAAALGSVRVGVGAVSALASTPAGSATTASTHYQLAGLSLTIGSPALARLFAALSSALDPSALTTLLGGLTGALPGNVLPAACTGFPSASLTAPLVLDGGAVTLDPTTGGLSVNLAALLRQLGLDLNALPANTDVLDYLSSYLSSSSGLATGIEKAIDGVTGTLAAKFTACAAALPGVTQAIDQLTAAQGRLTAAVNGLLGGLATGSGNPLAPLGTGLKQLLDIGVNVQPRVQGGSFHSALAATPNQATSPVPGQTVVRAVELDLVPASGQTVALALGNAAAGPSSPAAPVTAPAAPAARRATAAPGTALPTGVPAGRALTAGPSRLPLALLGAGLLLGAAGAGWAGLQRVRSGRRGA